jgi:predicted porin
VGEEVAALATLSIIGAASAQSSVTISGIIKGGVAQSKYSNSPTAANNGSGTSVADGSSRFALSGTEDLGGGLKAVFQIETRFRVDDNGGGAATPTTTAPSQLATGNTFVGLSGGFGLFQLGKLDTHYCSGSDTHGSYATALQASSCALLGFVNGSSSTVNAIANASRSSNTIRYTTPNFSGFQGQVGYSTGYATTGSEGAPGDAGNGRAYNAALNYGNGPIKAGLSLWNARSESRVFGATRNDQDAATLFGNYNFGVATVGLTYDRSQINVSTVGAADAKNRRSVWSIPVTIPLGAGTFLVTYTKASDVKLNGATVADSGASLWSVGYDYALSKRTSLGVSFARMNNKANANYNLYTQTSLNGTPNNGVGQDASQLYFGIRHAF